jgi:hypothetical protein
MTEQTGELVLYEPEDANTEYDRERAVEAAEFADDMAETIWTDEYSEARDALNNISQASADIIEALDDEKFNDAANGIYRSFGHASICADVVENYQKRSKMAESVSGQSAENYADISDSVKHAAGRVVEEVVVPAASQVTAQTEVETFRDAFPKEAQNQLDEFWDNIT